MASKAEQHTSRSLRAILAPLSIGASLRDCALRRDLLMGLEYFVPEVLSELYPEWEYAGLDGIYPLEGRKSGHDEAEFFGICILIADQTLTPIDLRVQAAESSDEISWIECRLGEKSSQGWQRLPFKSLNKALCALEGRRAEVDWVYSVTYGCRRV